MKVQNANMYQKSIIQQHLEHNNTIERFKNTLNTLMEQYTIQDNVFGCPNGVPSEYNTGYFVIEHECDNLQDAIRELSSLDKCIHIIENQKFQVGSFHRYISDCNPDSKVFDIENKTIVER